MTLPKISFTAITDKEGEITKIISLDPETGKIHKEGKASIWNGFSEHKRMLLPELPDYLVSLPPDKAITLGQSEYQSADIVTNGNENPPEKIARTKEFFHFSPQNQLLFFDYDSRGAEQDISPNEFIGIISEVIPGFKQAARAITYSTSSFIFDSNGNKVNDGDGFHIYFMVKDGLDIERFKTVLAQRLWINGYGYILNSSDGRQLERTIFDTFVFSPERLIFEAAPICKDGLEQRKPLPKYVDGDVLDTTALLNLTEDGKRLYAQAVHDAKEENRPIADEITSKYVTREVEKFVTKGVPEFQAQKIVESRKRCSLLDNEEITFDDGTVVTVKELCEQGKEYDGRPCYDPIEPDRGKSKACFYWNEGKNPVINSFLHGGQTFKFNRYDYAGSRNRGRLLGNEPSYPVERFYTPEEAGVKLENIIKTFIETGKDTAVLFEAGGGKTTSTIHKIADAFESCDKKLKGAYFVDGHQIADERIEDFRREIDIPKIIKVLGGTANKQDGGITIIAGIEKKCLLPNREGMVYDKELCDDCYHNAVEHECPYINQFGYYGNDRRYVFDNFRIYQHAHLFHPSSLDYGFDPDFIIIDEDVVSKMIQVFPIKKEDNQLIQDIIQLTQDGNDLLEILKRKEQSISKEITRLLHGKKPSDLSMWEMKFRTALNILYKYSNYDSKKRSRPPGKVWVEEDRLYVGWLEEIHKKWKGIPILYLDASGNEEIISLCLGRDFDFHRVRCHYQDNVKVIQVTNLSLSKNWINRNSKKEPNINKVKRIVEMFDDDMTGFISYKSIGKDDKGKSIPFITELVPDKKRCGWFGGLRGLNKFEELSTLVVIGHRTIGSEEMVRMARVVFDDHHGLSGNKMAVPMTVRMRNGKHRTLDNWEYVDERLRLLSDHLEKAETYQAIHRLRLLWGNQPKQVIYASNQVVDITVDRLITFEQLLNGMETIRLEDFIDEVGIWKYSDNKGLSGETGIPERTIRELKKQESDSFQVVTLDVREIKTSKKKNGMKFLVSNAIVDEAETLSSRLLERGYRLIASETVT